MRGRTQTEERGHAELDLKQGASRVSPKAGVWGGSGLDPKGRVGAAVSEQYWGAGLVLKGGGGEWGWTRSTVGEGGIRPKLGGAGSNPNQGGWVSPKATGGSRGEYGRTQSRRGAGSDPKWGEAGTPGSVPVSPTIILDGQFASTIISTYKHRHIYAMGKVLQLLCVLYNHRSSLHVGVVGAGGGGV